MIGCLRRKRNAKVSLNGRDRAGAVWPRTTRYPSGSLEESGGSQGAGWQSGWLLGSVVPWGAADSLVHEGEVLSLAEFSADTHKRHKGTAQIDTETLRKTERERQRYKMPFLSAVLLLFFLNSTVQYRDFQCLS